MKNPILLDSTWVDLHNEHIIWHVLVQNFCYSFKFIGKDVTKSIARWFVTRKKYCSFAEKLSLPATGPTRLRDDTAAACIGYRESGLRSLVLCVGWAFAEKAILLVAARFFFATLLVAALCLCELSNHMSLSKVNEFPGYACSEALREWSWALLRSLSLSVAVDLSWCCSTQFRSAFSSPLVVPFAGEEILRSDCSPWGSSCLRFANTVAGLQPRKRVGR
jgi:hypothetical protein